MRLQALAELVPERIQASLELVVLVVEVVDLHVLLMLLLLLLIVVRVLIFPPFFLRRSLRQLLARANAFIVLERVLVHALATLRRQCHRRDDDGEQRGVEQ